MLVGLSVCGVRWSSVVSANYIIELEQQGKSLYLLIEYESMKNTWVYKFEWMCIRLVFMSFFVCVSVNTAWRKLCAQGMCMFFFFFCGHFSTWIPCLLCLRCCIHFSRWKPLRLSSDADSSAHHKSMLNQQRHTFTLSSRSHFVSPALCYLLSAESVNEQEVWDTDTAHWLKTSVFGEK